MTFDAAWPHSHARLEWPIPHSLWINTMHRCAERTGSTGAKRRHAVAAMAAALLLLAIAPAADAQALIRRFPRTALRGEIVFGAFPQVLVNSQAAQLAPGSKVRDGTNLVALPGALAGNKYIVNYTIDSMGLVHDVWILRPDEIAVQPWPKTPVEALAWSFDDGAQVWSKP